MPHAHDDDELQGGFVLRLNLEGAALVALSMVLQQTLTGCARAGC